MRYGKERKKSFLPNPQESKSNNVQKSAHFHIPCSLKVFQRFYPAKDRCTAERSFQTDECVNPSGNDGFSCIFAFIVAVVVCESVYQQLLQIFIIEQCIFLSCICSFVKGLLMVFISFSRLRIVYFFRSLSWFGRSEKIDQTLIIMFLIGLINPDIFSYQTIRYFLQ